MTINLTVNTLHLCAARDLAPKDDVRNYLNGICVQSRGADVLIHVTNGHYLMTFQTLQPELAPVCQFIIPRDAIATLKPLKNLHSAVIEFNPPSGQGVDRFMGEGRIHPVLSGTIVFTPTEGLFPDVRKVMPKETSGECTTYDIGYLAAIEKAFRKCSRPTAIMEIHPNGDRNSGLLTCDTVPDAIAVIMPRNDGYCIREAFTTPHWAFEAPNALPHEVEAA